MITGATGQIGSVLSSGIAQRGGRVIVCDISKDKGEELVQEIKDNGGIAEFSLLDVTLPDTIKKTVDKCTKDFGHIDALINNAGVSVMTPFFERTSEEVDKVIDVNLKGVLNCSKIVAQEMAKENKGTIINIASLYGFHSPDPSIYGDSGRNSSEIYGMTKSGVIQLTKYLAVHLAEYSIRVNCISPGGISNNQDVTFVKRYSEKTVLGRMAYDSEILGPLIFLLSDASSYVCGHNLIVDGGYSIF